MENYQIEIEGKTYDILFTYRDKEDRLFLLLQQGDETFVTGYEEDESGNPHLFEADIFMIERILTAYNKLVQDAYFFDGKVYVRQSEAAGMILASEQDGDEDVLYPFSKETRQPVHVDEAGIKFIRSILKNALQENRQVILNARPGIDNPKKLFADPIAELDGVKVYLDFRVDKAGKLIFVEDGRPVVRTDRMNELHQKFLEWEQGEYEKELATRIENLV